MKLLKKLSVLAIVLAALCLVAFADGAAATPEEFYRTLLAHYEAQEEGFTITYTGDMTPLLQEDGRVRSCAEYTREMSAFMATDSGADIHMMNLEMGLCTRTGDRFNFVVSYLLDEEKLTFMENKAREIAQSLALEGMSDYQKIKTGYEYVASHFTYDYDLEKFTDYDGITTGEMVCQGYALLTYRLLWQAGIPNRIITGTSFQQPHGWNAVELRGKWYSLDTTWDAGDPMGYSYFLQSGTEFANHKPAAPFRQEAFLQAHPMSAEAFDSPRLEILVGGEAFGSLVIRNGNETRLTVRSNRWDELPIRWESSDPSIISIDADGTVHSLAQGQVYITATVFWDDSFIPAVFPVVGVDTRSCSPWAYEELNSLYMRSLYPAALCSDYEAPITREEFANLIYLLLSEYYPTSGSFILPEMEDLAGNEYWLAIAHLMGRRIMEGTSETTFSPTAPVTREQAAKILAKTMDFMLLHIPDGDLAYKDLDQVSPWALEYVQLMARTGLMEGDGAGSFLPRKPLTREQAAVLLERLITKYIEPQLAPAA